ncbi:recombination regulator RecX [Fructilactobacillus fructivorans]|uniref:recombination regulator RecX n=1 Tax=Fructilactobacillus fructivorans TaxID=1614 RepID=UPI0021AEE4F1|nr:recombination regulator RecX [Fructilactobacillus fructivorans]
MLDKQSAKKLKVTKIVTQKRPGRYNVYINDHYAFPVSEEVMIQFGIFKDSELDQNQINQIKAADDVSKLYNKAINFISYQTRSKKEVRDKLKSFSDNLEAIDKAVEQLEQINLLNDEHYADTYVKGVVEQQNKGPMAVSRYLKQKGIADESINIAIENNYPEEAVLRNGENQAKKVFAHNQRFPFNKRIQKTKTSLYRKGYSFDDIDTIISEMNFQGDAEQQDELLNKEGNKVWHKYRNYDDAKQRQKSKQSLYRKGFDLDDIDQFLDTKEN